MKLVNSDIIIKMLNFIFKKIFIFLILFSITSPVIAEDISVNAQVDINKVTVGSPFSLNITVTGNQNVNPAKFAEIDGLSITYQGTSRRVEIINGSYASYIVFSYSVFPMKAGKYEIPAVDFNINNQTYYTDPIPIEVTDAPSFDSNQQQNSVGDINDKLFIILKAPDRDVYINEKIPLKVILFYSVDLPIRNINYPKINNIGLSIDEIKDHTERQEIIKGIRFNIIEFNTFIYPTRTGKVELGPANIEFSLVNKTNRRRGFRDPFDMFDDSMFGGLFDSYETIPYSLNSEKKVINILNVPEENRPQNFSNGVGEFDFDMSIGSIEVKVGDPITVRMKISGTGNLSNIKFPEIREDESFKVYQPNIKEEYGVKYLEQVVIPKKSDIQELPKISFSYFDPVSKLYKTIEKGPFTIKVTPLAKGEEGKIVGLSPDKVNDIVQFEQLGEDIIFIKNEIGNLTKIGNRFYNNIFYYIFILGSLFLWMASYIGFKWTHRMKTDVAFARRMHAPKKARKDLEHAKKLMESGKKEEFFDALFKAIQHYFANKFHLPFGVFTFETIKGYLNDKSIKEEIIKDIKLIFESCDIVRYAAAKISDQDMKDSFKKAQVIIDYFERYIK